VGLSQAALKFALLRPFTTSPRSGLLVRVLDPGFCRLGWSLPAPAGIRNTQPAGVASPLCFPCPDHRRAVGVLDLPVPRRARSVRRAQPLRHDAFQAHAASLPEDGGAVLVGVLAAASAPALGFPTWWSTSKRPASQLAKTALRAHFRGAFWRAVQANCSNGPHRRRLASNGSPCGFPVGAWETLERISHREVQRVQPDEIAGHRTPAKPCRESTGNNFLVDERVGLDGKTRRLPKQKTIATTLIVHRGNNGSQCENLQRSLLSPEILEPVRRQRRVNGRAW
jgi:hypothetical protein